MYKMYAEITTRKIYQINSHRVEIAVLIIFQPEVIEICVFGEHAESDKDGKGS